MHHSQHSSEEVRAMQVCATAALISKIHERVNEHKLPSIVQGSVWHQLQKCYRVKQIWSHINKNSGEKACQFRSSSAILMDRFLKKMPHKKANVVKQYTASSCVVSQHRSHKVYGRVCCSMSLKEIQ